MTFRIIETNGYNGHITPELIHDYENIDLSVNEIKQKHNISSGAWQTVLKRLKAEGVSMRGYNKVKPVRKAKYYYFDRSIGRYRVYKYINNKQVLFGSYNMEKEAQSRVEELKQNNWGGLIDD